MSNGTETNMEAKQPNKKYTTIDNFIKWYDERPWGTEEGSLGLDQQTVGKIIQYDDFRKEANKLQSK